MFGPGDRGAGGLAGGLLTGLALGLVLAGGAAAQAPDAGSATGAAPPTWGQEASKDPAGILGSAPADPPEPSRISHAPDRPTPPSVTPGRTLRNPTPAEWAQVFPRVAARAGIGGGALINCRVTASTELADCKVTSEQPQGYGFGEAAVRLAQFVRVAPTMVDGAPVADERIDLPVDFSRPGAAPQTPAAAAAHRPVIVPPQMTGIDPSTASPPAEVAGSAARGAAENTPGPAPAHPRGAMILALLFGLAVCAAMTLALYLPEPKARRRPPGAYA